MLAGAIILAIALAVGAPGTLTVNVADPGATPVYTNVPLAAPCGMVTDVGATVAMDVSELWSVATNPPCGAGACNVRLAVAESPAVGEVDGSESATELVRLKELLVTEGFPLKSAVRV
jgi:hypothetical protein